MVLVFLDGFFFCVFSSPSKRGLKKIDGSCVHLFFFVMLVIQGDMHGAQALTCKFLTLQAPSLFLKKVLQMPLDLEVWKGKSLKRSEPQEVFLLFCFSHLHLTTKGFRYLIWRYYIL